MVNFNLLTAEIGSGVWAPQQISTGFASWLRYCSDFAQRKPTKLCTMFGRLLGWYTMYTFLRLLPAEGILTGAKFTLRPSLALFYIGSITARHSNSGPQPNFAALSRRCHLYSAGRSSRPHSSYVWSRMSVIEEKRPLTTSRRLVDRPEYEEATDCRYRQIDWLRKSLCRMR